MDLNELNIEQRDAVLTTEGPLLMLAGAGSGKTKALTYRIAYMIQEMHVSPHQILAITFTNKAAGELKHRIQNLIGADGAHVWAKTFHSACLNILRFEVDALPYKSNFVVYDDADQVTIMKRVLREKNIDEKKHRPWGFLNAISTWKSALVEPKDIVHHMPDDMMDPVEMRAVYERYQALLLDNNAMDFDDIINVTVRLFQKHPEILEKYQDRFRYIMVDEFQDTNHAQMAFVTLLAEKYKNICVVGDDDQSIYEWRGADITNILDFETSYPGCKVIKLEKNYRSTHNILEAANGVIRNNRGRKDKTLWTDREEGSLVVYYTAIDDSDEAFFIARQIRQLRAKEDISFNDFAIFSRTTAQFRTLEECMLRQKIPYKIYGGIKFYQRKEIKDIIAYLQTVANPDDKLSVRRALTTPRRGIGEATWEKLAGYAATNNITVLQAMKESEQAQIGTKMQRALKTFTDLIDEAKEYFAEHHQITGLVEYLLEHSGYKQMLIEEDSVESETRLDYLNEFLSITAQYDVETLLEEATLADFLSDIALYTDLDRVQEGGEEAVSIMTLHGAKGLEFPIVFMVGMEEKIFPHFRSMGSEEDIEEERRLCYVGMTRAESKLYLIRAERRMLYGKVHQEEPSRFLNEVPLIVVEDLNTRHNAAHSHEQREKQKPGSAADKAFILGDKITHSKWGLGVVVDVGVEGEHNFVKVAFPDEGIKKLLTKFAPISKVLIDE